MHVCMCVVLVMKSTNTPLALTIAKSEPTPTMMVTPPMTMNTYVPRVKSNQMKQPLESSSPAIAIASSAKQLSIYHSHVSS